MINCDGLVKIYETDDKKVMALEGLDLTVETRSTCPPPTP